MTWKDKLRGWSKWIIIVSGALLLVWDIFAQLTLGLKGTISYATWELAKTAPFIPFLAGFVMGHLFWGSPDRLDQRDQW